MPSRERILQLTKQYIQAFTTKNFVQVSGMFAPEFSLRDSNANCPDLKSSLELVQTIFKNQKVDFKPKDILIDGNTSLFQFTLELDTVKLEGIDIIQWNEQEKMVSLRAYLDPPK
ncbi:hypothetical protein EDD86DRAFT_249697 [Gorgonomyces haynaldii]|nr:hypothetical protein EDD86DRAFT_249697 [Gorgonomyces haynaldii]